MSRMFYHNGEKVVEGTPPPENNPLTAFQPYYDKVLRSWITSSHDQEKKMKEHRSYSHPMGLVAVQDDKKWMAENRYIRKHLEEYRETHYQGYKAGMADKGLYNAKDPFHDHSNKRTFIFKK